MTSDFAEFADMPRIVVVDGVSHFVTDRPSGDSWTPEEWLAFVDWSMQQEPEAEEDIIEDIL